jgi:hypothetical protein
VVGRLVEFNGYKLTWSVFMHHAVARVKPDLQYGGMVL